MKKVISLALSLIMIFVTTTVLPLNAQATDYYDISVSNLTVNSNNCNDFFGDGTVSYVDSTHTLTLNNADFSGVSYAVHYDFDSNSLPLTIVVKGNNTLSTNYYEGKSAYCIRSASFASGAGLIIKGDGTLNLNAYNGDDFSNGIAVGGDIRIQGNVKVNIFSDVDSAKEKGVGIESDNGKLTIADNAKITICVNRSPLYLGEGISFSDGYIPLIKVGTSASNITLTKTNPNLSQFQNDEKFFGEYKYVSIEKSSEKLKNTLTVKAKKPTIKYSKLKKKNQTIARKKAITVSNAKGTVTYSKISGNKKITINKSTGKITVKKGLKKGKYKVKIKVKAAGNASYKAITKTVTVTIKIN